MATWLVGCPVLRREWVLPAYVTHVRAAAERAAITVEYLFVGGAEDPSFEAVTGALEGERAHFVYVDEPRAVDARVWKRERWERMVELRNRLLGEVRQRAPAVFFSLDSDILVAADTVVCVAESLGRFDAVGACCYMGSGTACPSYAMKGPLGNLERRDQRGCVLKVDTVMAAVAMTPAAYAVDYAYDGQGEDVGWSRNARAAGLRLGWDARTVSKHVMRPEHLDRLDRRCGF